MNFAKFQKNAIAKTEQRKVTGGDIWDLINDAWNATPDGGVGYWENDGNGTFNGLTWGPNDGFGGSTLGPY